MTPRDLAHRLRAKCQALTASLHSPTDVQRVLETPGKYAFTVYGNDGSILYVTVAQIKGANPQEAADHE